MVDVFGYDPETEQFDYSVKTTFSCKCRRAKAYYKSPDRRNPWRFPHGIYIFTLSTPAGKNFVCFWIDEREER